MANLLDIIGSTIIGGIIVLMLVVFNGNVVGSSGLQTFKTIVAGNTTALSDIVENDLRKAGYRVPTVADSAITYADSNKITFKGDFNDDGVVETMEYYFDPTPVAGISNRHIGVLYRHKIGQAPQAMYLGVTRFCLKYYDKNDQLFLVNRVMQPSKIRSVRISATVESSERFAAVGGPGAVGTTYDDTTYSGIYWERKIKPKNMR